MPNKVHPVKTLHFLPATPDRWNDIEKLFGERGACGGCWCMTWRQSASEFQANKGEKNRRKFRAIVKKGSEPGVLAYDDAEPVGWCAVAPRDQFPRLENSRVWARVDDEPVWSVTCLFVRKDYRNKGLSSSLVEAAVRLAKRHGAKLVEAYPQDLKKSRLPDSFVWTGLLGSFEKAGFEVAVRRSAKKLVMRKKV